MKKTTNKLWLKFSSEHDNIPFVQQVVAVSREIYRVENLLLDSKDSELIEYLSELKKDYEQWDITKRVKSHKSVSEDGTHNWIGRTGIGGDG